MLRMFLVLLSFISFFSSSFGYTEKELMRKELKFDYKNEGYFRRITNLYIINNKLFIIDQRSNLVLMYEFDSNGIAVFKRNIGNIGNGPGDIMGPFNIVADADTMLAINHQGFVSFFNYDGQYISQFRLFVNHISSLLYKNNYYYLSANPKSDKLVNIYSKYGNLINSICDKSVFVNNKEGRKTSDPFVEYNMYSGNIFTDDNSLIYINKRFGTITRFSMIGELIEYGNIGEYFGKNGIQKINDNKNILLNEQNEEGIRRNTLGVYSVYQQAAILGDEIYFLCDQHNRIKNEPIFNIEIIGINKKTFKKTAHYNYTLEKGNWLSYFAVRLSNGKPVFLLDIKSLNEAGIYEFYIKE